MYDRLIGSLLLVLSLAVAAAEWTDAPALYLAAGGGVALAVVLLLPTVPKGRWPFPAVAAGLALWALIGREDGAALVEKGLLSAGFIAGFFVALAWLRSAAAGSAAIARCGQFLADQPPGRRYAALTAGGHLFALVLSYGAISLLGGLAEASARREPNREIAEIRVRRMLLAIQRGFTATLPWSPLAFAMAVTLTLVPGATWSAAAPWCVVTAALMIGLGWAVDTIVKPKLAGPRPEPRRAEGGWGRLKPLLLLLAVIVGTVGGLQAASGLGAIPVIMVAVPAVSLGWIALQAPAAPEGTGAHLAGRLARFVGAELPGYRSEIVLLTTAGFIGTLGSALLAPLIAGLGLDLAAIPAWALLLAVMWLIPIGGQLGMNPILAVSLIAPLLPSAEALGVSPAAVVVAITAGWALSGVTSPYTATTLLVGAFGHVSARRVGLVWNGIYVAVTVAALSAWVVFVATR